MDLRVRRAGLAIAAAGLAATLGGLWWERRRRRQRESEALAARAQQDAAEARIQQAVQAAQRAAGLPPAAVRRDPLQPSPAQAASEVLARVRAAKAAAPPPVVSPAKAPAETPPKARPLRAEDWFSLSKRRLSADAPEFVPGSSNWAGGGKEKGKEKEEEEKEKEKEKEKREKQLAEVAKPRPNVKLPLRDRLTVILSTSPVGRHPATDLIDEVLGSMRLASGLQSCDLIVVCDGYRTEGPDGQPFAEPRYRSGIVDPASAANYEKYKAVLKLRRRTASSSQPGLEVLELDSRHGFGFAVRAAMDYVRTPYVIVMQHDRPFTKNVDVPRVLAAMEANPSRYKYVGMPTQTTFDHQYHVLSKYGIRLERVKADDRGLQFIPLIQWYDSTHIAETDYYRHFVFGPRRLVVRGGFIEDKFGQAMLADIRERGVAVAHPEYGTFIAAGSGFPEPCVGHLDGRDARCGEKFKHVKPAEAKEEGTKSEKNSERLGPAALQLKNSVQGSMRQNHPAHVEPPSLTPHPGWPAPMPWGAGPGWRPPGQSTTEAFDPPIRAKSLYIFDGHDGRREWRPCEVLNYDYAEHHYLIRWPDGSMKRVTALQLILDYDQAGAMPPPYAPPPQRLPLAPLTALPAPPPWPADRMSGHARLAAAAAAGTSPAARVAPGRVGSGGVGSGGGNGGSSARPAAPGRTGATPAPAGPVRAPAQLAKEAPKAAPAPSQSQSQAQSQAQSQSHGQSQAQSQSGASGPACPASGWQYVDPKQNVQGPFTRVEMAHWHTKGYFTPDLRMRCSNTDQFIAFSELFPSPLVPFQSYPKRPPSQSGQQSKR